MEYLSLFVISESNAVAAMLSSKTEVVSNHMDVNCQRQLLISERIHKSGPRILTLEEPDLNLFFWSVIMIIMIYLDRD